MWSVSDLQFPNYFTLGAEDEDMGHVCVTFDADEVDAPVDAAGDEGHRRRVCRSLDDANSKASWTSVAPAVEETSSGYASATLIVDGVPYQPMAQSSQVAVTALTEVGLDVEEVYVTGHQFERQESNNTTAGALRRL